ncbi:hypothetical protein A2701_01335 [Candidatus Amesbacteria bacterium RIFCSPHIGHO2_01_FULL_47_34]|nr:MAG: hypothetical protein A2701_01335 [Candidatus Amesbacteria bacterium RIFCSPHIGHO2_01_FULL_47_34]
MILWNNRWNPETEENRPVLFFPRRECRGQAKKGRLVLPPPPERSVLLKQEINKGKTVYKRWEPD